LTIIEALRYFVLMLRCLTVISVLVVLLPASAVDAFLHLHDDPDHDHHATESIRAGILHTHLEAATWSDNAPALTSDSGEWHDELRFADLFRFVPSASFLPVVCVETVEFLSDTTCLASRFVEVAPSSHDPPPLDCSIPRSPPA